MLEVEVKYRCADWDTLRAKLLDLGAVSHPPREEIDHYFNAPDRDFARTDEALRIRKVGEAYKLTYKGPKLEAETKTRTEIEFAFDSPDKAAALFSALGYRSVAVISKLRRVCSLRRNGFDFEICFDDAGANGKFVELEIQALPDKFEAAKAELLAFAIELGLTEVEKRSYLRMHLERKGLE